VKIRGCHKNQVSVIFYRDKRHNPTGKSGTRGKHRARQEGLPDDVKKVLSNWSSDSSWCEDVSDGDICLVEWCSCTSSMSEDSAPDQTNSPEPPEGGGGSSSKPGDSTGTGGTSGGTTGSGGTGGGTSGGTTGSGGTGGGTSGGTTGSGGTGGGTSGGTTGSDGTGGGTNGGTTGSGGTGGGTSGGTTGSGGTGGGTSGGTTGSGGTSGSGGTTGGSTGSGGRDGKTVTIKYPIEKGKVINGDENPELDQNLRPMLYVVDGIPDHRSRGSAQPTNGVMAPYSNRNIVQQAIAPRSSHHHTYDNSTCHAQSTPHTSTHYSALESTTTSHSPLPMYDQAGIDVPRSGEGGTGMWDAHDRVGVEDIPPRYMSAYHSSGDAAFRRRGHADVHPGSLFHTSTYDDIEDGIPGRTKRSKRGKAEDSAKEKKRSRHLRSEKKQKEERQKKGFLLAIDKKDEKKERKERKKLKKMQRSDKKALKSQKGQPLERAIETRSTDVDPRTRPVVGTDQTKRSRRHRDGDGDDAGKRVVIVRSKHGNHGRAPSARDKRHPKIKRQRHGVWEVSSHVGRRNVEGPLKSADPQRRVACAAMGAIEPHSAGAERGDVIGSGADPKSMAACSSVDHDNGIQNENGGLLQAGDDRRAVASQLYDMVRCLQLPVPHIGSLAPTTPGMVVNPGQSYTTINRARELISIYIDRLLHLAWNYIERYSSDASDEEGPDVVAMRNLLQYLIHGKWTSAAQAYALQAYIAIMGMA